MGLIDIEYEKEEKTVCSRGEGLGGMVWHIAVHPDYYRQGIGERLLQEAEKRAIDLGLNRFEAWTREANQKSRFKGAVFLCRNLLSV
ncbi:GNAT family N-acetyltransferase [Lysinibacillus fusiformis]|nr:GNAT family N-acetyltransferase [Lysinibacillus fusiformis]